MTPAERLRQHQRALAKAQRELDRERTKLEQQEKKLIMDIKKSAKAGQMVCINPISLARLLNVVHRTPVKSWPKTLSALVATCRSSIRCERSYKPSVCGYKPYGVTSRWQKPCAARLAYVLHVPANSVLFHLPFG